MTLTYTDDHARPYGDPLAARPHVDASPARTEEPYVPVYARGKSRKARRSGVRSWMILAPVGVLVLGGAAAMMLMDGGREAGPLEPAATAPVLPATAPAALAVTTAPTVAPVEAAPLPRDSAPAARAPVRRAAPPAAPARRVEAAPAPVRPAATAETSETVTLNTAPTTTDAPPPPRIVVAPLE